MGKTAFVFPGQGSQKVGMGSDLLEARPEVFDKYLGLAEEASGLEIRRLCLEGPIEDLTSTDAAQPALFATSLAVLEVAREDGLQCDFVAGHSLGEYTAAVASGALGLEDGMRLVARRGALMAAAQSERPGAMAAIIGLSAETVSELCAAASAEGPVAPANLNTPVQIVCSGEEAAVLKLIGLAETAGADKALRLNVGAAFHSVLMEPTQAKMAEAMAEVGWSDPATPLVGNATGKLRTTADEVREALIAQIASPVLWVDSVRTLRAEGCDVFLEIGAGRTLSGLIRQIDRDAETFAADSPKKLAKFADRQV
ncbi:MAG: [acyl-carrier-protein] S-malonyltransferase [Solirubrobacteraceae bacterium]|jgi:[acyl-carrier-protein] S-malonyltransferase|nr:[acyl-carrier-protein] S-malonyltransferase [Solirubrobacteraceae bacterium]